MRIVLHIPFVRSKENLRRVNKFVGRFIRLGLKLDFSSIKSVQMKMIIGSTKGRKFLYEEIAPFLVKKHLEYAVLGSAHRNTRCH